MNPYLTSHNKPFYVITAGRLLLFVCLLAGMALSPVKLSPANCHYCSKLPYLLGSAFLLTTVYLIWYRTKGFSPLLIHIQTIFDVILAGATVYMTGGVSSSFTFFFAIAILTASLLGGEREGAFSALTNTIMYLLILLATADNAWDRESILYTFFINLAAFNLTAAIGIYIAAKQKRTEDELFKTTTDLILARRLQEHLAESMNSGLLILDRNTNIIFANNAAKNILNIVNMSGVSIYDIFNKDKKIIDRLIQTEKIRQEIEYRTDEEKKIIGISGFPILDTRENIMGYGLIFQDITEEKRQNEKLRRMDRLAALGEMAAGLAHEIRNPLASISGAAEVLME
jgi:two-component system sensor histidine kinase PilS (NtrC family)